MALGAGGDHAETLNSIFRAAHSIKGGSGTFGFTQLTDATHEMETLFDGLRKGKGRADATTVRILLDACDVFKAHIARLKAGDRGNDPAMDGVRAQLIGYRASGAGAAPVATAKSKAKAKGKAAPAKPTEESFFDSAPEPKAGTAYGLFEETEAAPVANEKFGFFEPPAADASTEPSRRKGDSSSIRVSVEKIDRIVNLVGELVIAQAMLQQSAANSQAGDERLAHSLATLDRNTRDLQQAVMSIRMMPWSSSSAASRAWCTTSPPSSARR